MDRPEGKRVGPPKVQPVRIGGFTIEALHWGKERGLGQNGGYIRALDPTTGTERWTLQVYPVRYEGGMEEDVQDVFIKSLEPADGEHTLDVTDELGRTFTVDVAERKVVE